MRCRTGGSGVHPQQEATMTTYYEFRSEKDPALHGLTDDPAGDKLSADNGPWTLVRQVASEESWTLGFSKAASIAGVALPLGPESLRCTTVFKVRHRE